MNDPATKYRDKVDPDHAIAMQAIGFARMALDQHRAHYERLLASRQYMDSVGGLLDPTLYLDMLRSKSFAQQQRLVEATLAFLKQVDAVAAEINPGGAV